MGTRIRLLALLLGCLNLLSVVAEEGMWIPSLLGELNIGEMQDMGLKLEAGDIYNVNHTGITDAVVSLGGFCTASVISDQGLIITNHHCGLTTIQSHSTLDKNYLEEGFWAMDLTGELPNPGLYVRFLRHIEDVTEKVLEGWETDVPESKRTQLVNFNIQSLKANIRDTSDLKAEVIPFYYGNQYYLFLYEEFQDVRLVAAPPSSIGKFGGNMDNWVWPRHSGDFSLLRIYADEENKPAQYSTNNVPYRPKRHLEISMKGVEEGDFTMVAGFPGTTTRYLVSGELEYLLEESLPRKAEARTLRMEVMEEFMAADDETALRYASKYSDISNYQKKWLGQIRGGERSGVLIRKREEEKAFDQWAGQEGSGRYVGLVDSIQSLVQEMQEIALLRDYEREVIRSLEVLRFSGEFRSLQSYWAKQDTALFKNANESLHEKADEFYKNYNPDIDLRITARLLEVYFRDIPNKYHPELAFDGLIACGGDYQSYTSSLFSRSLLVNREETLYHLDNFSKKSWIEIQVDPIFRLGLAFDEVFSATDSIWAVWTRKKTVLYRRYIEGLQAWNSESVPYPDANKTMRISYGKVEGYRPRDAIRYGYMTTLEGIFQKLNMDLPDYEVPEKLMELHTNRNMPVCFLASNHTTNGNSGSPVLNSRGQLIGVNFDRNMEGTISDFTYCEEQCRNISVDIRYVLFIIDKFAGMGYLMDEMDISH